MTHLSSYNGRKVLITGHTGFKGSWLTLILSQLGANVMGYALDPANRNDNYNLISSELQIKDIRADIRDFSRLSQIFKEFQPEIVFHLAAQAIVLYSYQNPKETFETNVQGTVNILECAKNCDSVQALIIVTSDKCYENQEWLWGYRENDKLGGLDPYSASKACAEIVTNSYLKSFGNSLKVASFRAGNVIGGGDWASNRIVPDCIRGLIDHKPIVMRNPGSIRPWQHVLDPLNAYLHLALHLSENPQKYQGAWNVGPEQSSMQTVRSLVEKVIKYWGSGTMQIAEGTQTNYETKTLFLDTTKISSILHWKPIWNFDETVMYTVEWYLKYSQGADMGSLARKQIENFFSEPTNAN